MQRDTLANVAMRINAREYAMAPEYIVDAVARDLDGLSGKIRQVFPDATDAARVDRLRLAVNIRNRLFSKSGFDNGRWAKIDTRGIV